MTMTHVRPKAIPCKQELQEDKFIIFVLKK